MLPTLAERLREQQAKTRGRRASRPPWPVPGEPPTALLFQARPESPSPVVHGGSAVTAVSAVFEPDPRPPAREAAATEIATPEVLDLQLLEPELSGPELPEPQTGAPCICEPQNAWPELAAGQPPAAAVSVAPPAPVPHRPVMERTALRELLLLLVWAVLVVIDGSLALASLIDGAARRQRRPQPSPFSPSVTPPFLLAAAAP